MAESVDKTIIFVILVVLTHCNTLPPFATFRPVRAGILDKINGYFMKKNTQKRNRFMTTF